MTEARIRCFIALDIDDKGVLDHILTFQEALVQTGADIKCVKTGNIHITFKFFGELPAPRVLKISSELEKIRFNPFDISLKAVHVFPDVKHIRVVWIGIEQGTIELVNLSKLIEVQLQNLGFRVDDKDFRPHITVARIRSGKNKKKIVALLSKWKDEYFGNFTANYLRLKQSVLTPEGPIYSTLLEVCGTEH